MIRKSELADAINGLNNNYADLFIRVHRLESEINALKAEKFKPKRGRPAGSTKKSAKAKAQPRNKDGKFVKKN